MALSKTLLKQIIKEEISKALNEAPHNPLHTKMAIKTLKNKFGEYDAAKKLSDDAHADDLADAVDSIARNVMRTSLDKEQLTALRNIYLFGTGKHLSDHYSTSIHD